MIFTLKIAISAVVIAFASWLLGQRPELVGLTPDGELFWGDDRLERALRWAVNSPQS